MAQVLIVDGSPEALQSLSSPLSQRGFDVAAAAAVKQALSLCRCESPRLLISELHLPDGTGFDLLREVRATGSSIAFVILTRSPSIRTAVRAIQLGAQDYLEKPLSPSMAVHLVESLIGSPDTKPESTMSTTAAHAMRVIQREFRRPGMSTRVVAGELGVSVEHVCRSVKTSSGRSVRAIIRELRVMEAASLLRTSTLLVKEVAYALGYRTVAMCERDFRRHFGCSPKGYRARTRAQPSISGD